MRDVLVALVVACALFAIFLLSLEIGFRIGAKSPDKERLGIAVIEGAVFGLLGLLLAFTFGTDIAHFDERRQLIVKEANAVEDAYRGIDLLPPDEQPKMRMLFARYIDARLAAYQNVTSLEVRESSFNAADAIQNQIWQMAVYAWRGPNRPELTLLLVPALNDMFGVAEDRKVALTMHNPAVVIILLVGVGLLTCVLGGTRYPRAVGARRSMQSYMLLPSR